MAVVSAAAGCGSFSAQGRNAEGARLFEQRRYQEAMQQFQQAAYDDPANPDSYYNLAAVYHRVGRLENRPQYLTQAEDLYNQCLDRHPNHRDCYRALAVLLAEQGRNEEAFRLLQGWVERQPGAADARIELARLHEETGDRSAAKSRLLDALAIEPDNTRALAALGKLREDAGESAQALSAYQRSLARENRQPELAVRLAALQAKLQPTSPYSASPTVPPLTAPTVTLPVSDTAARPANPATLPPR